MTSAATTPAKYVFLDVVRFTQGRSVEAQSDIVGALNDLVRRALAEFALTEDQVILLPTGDGICIALLNVTEPFDVHLLLALGILQGLREHNERIVDETRRFALRVGVNENVDNLVTDVNGRRNVAGAGINEAQRVMTFAEENHVFVGRTVQAMLIQRERYMEGFRLFNKPVKHGHTLTAYQYIQPHSGLNVEVPATLAPKEPKAKDVKLTRTVACYIAHAFTNREFVHHHVEDDEYGTIALLWLLAMDSDEGMDLKPYERLTPSAPEGDTMEGRLAAVNAAPFAIRQGYANRIIAEHLAPYRDYFEEGRLWRHFLIPTEAGLAKLRSEYPVILDKIVAEASRDESNTGE